MDEVRRERNDLGKIWHTARRWLLRSREVLSFQSKQTRVAKRQAAKFQSETEKLKVALELARHKIEQTLEGQYGEGQALQAALFVINQAIPRSGETR